MILVCGALHWDVVVRAPHLPRLDETLRGSSVAYRLGGKGGNQALAAVRAGAGVRFAGRVGADAAGAAMLARLRHGGVDTTGVQQGRAASGMSVAIVEDQGEYGAVIVSAENMNIDAQAIEIKSDTSFLVLQNEIDPNVNLTLAQRALARGLAVMLNAAPAQGITAELLGLISCLVVNRIEAADLAVRFGTNHLADLCPDAAIIETLGEDGVRFGAGGAKPRHLPAHKVDVVSTHGAGDVFVGTLAAALSRSEPLERAVAQAQEAAARHVSAHLNDRQTDRQTDV